MENESVTAFFDNLYNETYHRTVVFVTRRCDDPTQIADILQDIYTDIYAVLSEKDLGYIKNPAAFVQHVAKKKLARYYGWKSRLNNLIPMFLQYSKSDDEYWSNQTEPDDIPIEDLVETKLLLSEIADIISEKPADVQKIFQLHYALDMPIKQISAELKLRESTVKTKLYRTLEEIRNIYKKER